MNQQTPIVTVIMPVRNEADFIDRSLTAVLAQTYPHDRLEVLIADGMSTDTTRSIITGLAKETPNIPLMVIDNPEHIVPTGLNRMITQARGEIIVRVDGHCEIAPDYISCCVDHLLNDGVDGVGGPLTTIATTNIGRVIAAAMGSRFGVGNSAFRTRMDETRLVDTVAFPAYTRQALNLAGPFDEELVRNQDDEYNYRLRKLGMKILLAEDVKARYYSRTDLRSLWRQYFQYGYWKVRVLQKHPRQMSLRQFVPPAFVLTLLSGMLLSMVSQVGLTLWFVLIGVYLVANLVASVSLLKHVRMPGTLLLPVTFAVLHISYGLGFLVGLVRFAGRWRVSGFGT